MTKMSISTLADLQAATHRFSLDTRDAVAQYDSMHYEGDGFLGWQGASLFSQDAETAVLEELAYRQLVYRLQGPPTTWLQDRERCPADLEQYLVDRLLRHRAALEHKHLLLRLRDTPVEGRGQATTVRAVLSNEYTPFDNHQFVDMVGEALDTLGDGVRVDVVRAHVGDTLRAYLLLPDIDFNLPNGDDNGGLHPAVYLSNSEVGTGSVRVTAAVWRGICTNGLIYGWDAEWNRNLVHRYYTQAAFSAVVADNLSAALKMSHEAAERFVSTYTIPVNGKKLRSLIDTWAADGITVKARDQWEDAVKFSAHEYHREPGDMRLFDVLNGLTVAAQVIDNGDEQENMERLAGHLLGTLASGGPASAEMEA